MLLRGLQRMQGNFSIWRVYPRRYRYFLLVLVVVSRVIARQVSTNTWSAQQTWTNTNQQGLRSLINSSRSPLLPLVSGTHSTSVASPSAASLRNSSHNHRTSLGSQLLVASTGEEQYEGRETLIKSAGQSKYHEVLAKSKQVMNSNSVQSQEPSRGSCTSWQLAVGSFIEEILSINGDTLHTVSAGNSESVQPVIQCANLGAQNQAKTAVSGTSRLPAASTLLIVIVAAKVAVDLTPIGDDAMKYSYGVAALLNFVSLCSSAAGTGAIGVILTQYCGYSFGQPLTQGSLLLVFVIFLPQLASYLLRSLLSLVCLWSVRRLVARQCLLYQRIEATFTGIQARHAQHSPLIDLQQQQAEHRKSTRRVHCPPEMLLKQGYLVRTFQLCFVPARLVQFNRQLALQLGQRRHWWTVRQPNHFRALFTGYRQLCVIRLVQDMYNKQGSSERRGTYQTMGRALAAYAPIRLLLVRKQVPYESLTLLRVVLRSLGVSVGDFDVRYTADYLQHLSTTMWQPSCLEGDSSSSNVAGPSAQHRGYYYGSGNTSSSVIQRARREGYQGTYLLPRTPKWYSDLAKTVPGAKRSAVDFLLRVESNWDPSDPRWAQFQTITLSRHRVNGIAAKLTPAGRELTKVVSAIADINAEVWLDPKSHATSREHSAQRLVVQPTSSSRQPQMSEEPTGRNDATFVDSASSYIGLQQSVDAGVATGTEAMVLADLLYWAAESGALRIQGRTRNARLDLWNHRSMTSAVGSASPGWSSDEGSFSVAQDSILSRLMALPSHVLLPNEQLPEVGQTQTLDEKYATAAFERMARAVEAAFDAVAEVRKVLRAVQEWSLNLEEQLKGNEGVRQERATAMITSMGRIDDVFSYPIQVAELSWSSIKGKLSTKSQLMDTSAYTFEDIWGAQASLRWISLQIKATVVKAVKQVSIQVLPHAAALFNEPATVWAQHDYCQVLLWNFDLFYDALYQANRLAWHAEHVVDLVCLSSEDAATVPKAQARGKRTIQGLNKDRKGDAKSSALDALEFGQFGESLSFKSPNDSPRKSEKVSMVEKLGKAQARLMTCLLTESRMVLVTMLLMSGLWPRLQAAQASNEVGEPSSKEAWDIEDWWRYLIGLLDDTSSSVSGRALHARKSSTDTGLLHIAEFAGGFSRQQLEKASNSEEVRETAQQALDPFTGHALTKLMDQYQQLLVQLARDCFARELKESGGTYQLVRALDSPSLRAAAVASVVGGLELSREFLGVGQAATGHWQRWWRSKISTDPLAMQGNFERFPSVRDDDVDSEDGWF